MLPTKLRLQTTHGAKKVPLDFVPIGKTLVGGTQWAFQVRRPGIAKATIQPKAKKTVVSTQPDLKAKAVAAKAKGTMKKLTAKAAGIPKVAKVKGKKLKMVPKGFPKGPPPGVGKRSVKLPPPPPSKRPGIAPPPSLPKKSPQRRKK
jgi:hypothetical protein